MSINYRRTRECLQAFDFRKLFIEYLGWGNARGRTTALVVNELRYHATPIAELGGMVVFTVESQGDAPFPNTSIQKRIERDLGKIAHEHLIICLDANKTKATWLWVKRGIHTTAKDRRHTYERGQPGDALLRKLAGIVFRSEDLDAEGRASIVDVTSRIAKAFDVERVTKRFYDDFKTEHKKLLDALDGIDDADDRAWYTSVMLNRVMFVYFIQYKNLLDNDPEYLSHKLAASKKARANRFYRGFLTMLFFEGFAHEESQRSAETRRLLGRIPYLNGDLFTRHEIEERDGDKIDIPDRAFERLFDFFGGWDWVLEPRSAEFYIDHPNAKEEINPDVLGYIFEKYINQKEMGAYYTKEDITGYISRNTVLPFLMDKLGRLRHAAVNPLPLKDIDPFIYPAVSQEEYLPTETEREYVARKKRLKQIRDDFAAGKIATINAFITYNLDIEAFVQDFLQGLTDPLTLRAFYFECLKKLTVLDPTVGSGAFLFAAMNILETLYELCLDKMEELASPKFPDFAEELKRIAEHPNRAYFIFKSIIVNNLYGVDILEEATEICKLRLFLKLVAQVERDDAKPNFGIEPLPDIDFNIRAGNTLVGYASLAEVEEAGKRSLFSVNLPNKIRESDVAIRAYRDLQTRLGISARDLAQAKQQTAQKLGEIESELNKSLSDEYGARHVETFVKTHQPFHWYVEFNQIMQDGGFDVTVGNPPYVEYSKVKKQYQIQGYKTESCGNLYAFVIERGFDTLRTDGRMGMIVQLPIVCTDRMKPLQDKCLGQSQMIWFANFDDRPAKLFDGLQHIRASIFTNQKGIPNPKKVYSTTYNRWYSEMRPQLFELLCFEEVTDYLRSGSIPKIGHPIGKRLIQRFQRFTPLGRHITANTRHATYFHNSPQYWIRAMNFLPYFWNERDGEQLSTQVKILNAPSKLDASATAASLNSSLFYWWFVALSDCRHLNLREIESFPIGLDRMTESNKTRLAELTDQLMADYKKHAVRKETEYQATGKVVYDEFYPRYSKPIIDEIDRVLAKHYGFTDEELDFIINYDIKYRMGRAAEEEEDEGREE